MDLIATPDELQAVVGIDAQTIRRHAREGKLKHVERIGGRWFINATREWPGLGLRRKPCEIKKP